MRGAIRFVLTIMLVSIVVPCSAQDSKIKEKNYPISIKWSVAPSEPVAPWDVPVILYKKTSPTIQHVTSVTIIEKLIFTDSYGKLQEGTATNPNIAVPGMSGSIENNSVPKSVTQLHWRISQLYGKGIVRRALFDPSKNPDDSSAQLSNWLELPVIVEKP